MAVVFTLGYYCALRGSTEHTDLMMENVFEGQYEVEDGEEVAGIKYIGVQVPFSKTRELGIGKTNLPPKQDFILTIPEDPNHDCFNPYAIIKYYIDHCHPHAKKFYARPARTGKNGEAETFRKQFNKDIWYVESGPGRPNHNDT